MTTRAVLLFVAIVLTGLTAGLFYGWSVAAIPGLVKVKDRTYVATMQSINRAILNPLFFVIFFGAVLALVAAAIAHFREGQTRRAWWIVAAGVTYAVGVLGVTIVRNVPLNDALERFDLESASDDAIAEQRRDYETRWNRWQHRRAALNVAAFALVTVAALTTADD